METLQRPNMSQYRIVNYVAQVAEVALRPWSTRWNSTAHITFQYHAMQVMLEQRAGSQDAEAQVECTTIYETPQLYNHERSS
jgi:hypothetical protein